MGWHSIHLYWCGHVSTAGTAERDLWLVAGLAILGGAFAGWGLLLMSRCFVSAQSHLARAAEKAMPNAAGLDDAAILVVVLLLPPALTTLVLRWIGVRGQRRSGVGITDTMSKERCIKTIERVDGKARVFIFERPDRSYRFEAETEWESKGEVFMIPSDISGIYESAEAAEQAAEIEVLWLRDQLVFAKGRSDS